MDKGMGTTTRRRVRARRFAAVVTAAAVLGGVASSTSTAVATPTFAFTRVAGADRYSTAASLAVDEFKTSSGAIIATAETFPDALAASFIAGYVNSPILLVARNSIPTVTSDALTTLGVKEVVLLGGTAAISKAVEDQLDAKYDVARLFGSDRFATAANIALAVNPGDIGELDGKRTAFLTNGYSFADALALGPLANAGRFPVLLNGTGGLGSPARAVFDRLKIARVIIVGGVGAISDGAAQEIAAMGITTERVSGPNRFATAAAIADFALARLDFVDDHVNLVKGIDPADPRQGFADALAGSVQAGRERAPVLLTAPGALSAETRTWLESHASTLADGGILGGASAVASSTEAAARRAARTVSGVIVSSDPSTSSYVRTDPSGTNVTVTYGEADHFRVNGADATLARFQGALSAGDRVRNSVDDVTYHDLVDVAPAPSS
jgi:putative cell wall-binding protein